MNSEEQELEDEYMGSFGDPRRCPHHPGIATSSADGMFDAPCGACEYIAEHGEEYIPIVSTSFGKETLSSSSGR